MPRSPPAAGWPGQLYDRRAELWRLTTGGWQLSRRCVFPLHELYISSALIILIVIGLYFWLGAWGPVLLWGIATLFSNCLAGMPFIFYSDARDRYREGKRGAAVGLWLCSLLFAALWLGLLGYCGYRAYLAIP